MLHHRGITLGCLFTLAALVACAPRPNEPDPATGEVAEVGRVSARPNFGSSALPTTPSPSGERTPTPRPVLDPPRTTPQPTPKTPPPPGVVSFEELPGDPTTDGKTVLTGVVYNSAGEPVVRGPNITVRHEKNGEKAVNVENGKYVFEDLSLVGDLSITVDQYGFTPRTQHVKLLKGRKYTLNFGEPGTPSHMYALNDTPEIAKVEPNQFTKSVAGDKIGLTLTLSEALNEPNRIALLHALRLVPVNAVAAGGTSDLPDLSALAAEDALKPTDSKLDGYPYTIPFFTAGPPAEGSKIPTLTPKTFYGVAAATGVDSSERVLSVGFNVPLLNGAAKGGRYMLLCVADPNTPVKDVNGKLLGTDATGKLGTMPPAGAVLNNVFLSPYNNRATFKADDESTRWDSTHVNAIAFTLTPDARPPKLREVRAFVTTEQLKDNGSPYKEVGTYLELVFDEALVALGPDKGLSRESVRNIANYSFAIGQNTEYLASSALLSGGLRDPQDPVILLPSDSTDFGADGTKLGKEFRLVPQGADDVKVEIVSLATVRITIKNAKLFDPVNARAIMARVAGIEDPAANVLPAPQADVIENQPRAPIEYKKNS